MIISDEDKASLGKSLKTEESSVYENKGGNYVYNVRIELLDKYVWLYFEYDNRRLYGENVLDTDKGVMHKNRRPKKNVELKQQLFVVIDIEQERIYSSDSQKKTLIKNYLLDVTNVKIDIKRVYSSLDDFEMNVKMLKKVKLTMLNNMTNNLDPQSIFVRETNKFGLDLPKRLCLQAEYDGVMVNKVRKVVENLRRKKDQGYYNDVVLIGTDEEGFESIFDFNHLTKNIQIDVHKNEDDRFDELEVKKEIIRKLDGYV